jgi:hypothetical protein
MYDDASLICIFYKDDRNIDRMQLSIHDVQLESMESSNSYIPTIETAKAKRPFQL